MNKKIKIALLILLVLLSLVVRLQTDHQTDFDSYWLHAQAESIQLHKSALWIFHPASFIGYYPLSYPSGVPFYLATFSELTGLPMNMTVFASSLVTGLLATFMTFLVAREIFPKWSWAYFSALIMSLSPIIINYSAFNAGGRIFIMPFYLLFIWSVLRFYKCKQKKYIALGLLSIFLSIIIHRTSQLIVIFGLAFICAYIYEKIPTIWKFLRNHSMYKNKVTDRYERNKYYLLLDFFIIGMLLITVKIADLISRNRLGNNVNKIIIEPIQHFLSSSQSNYFFIAFFLFLLVIAILYIVLHYFKKINIVRKPFELFHHHYHAVFDKPDRYFLLFLGVFAAFMFFRQFFGQSFYSPSINDFSSTDLLSGTSPVAIFINTIFNYTTSVTPLFIFSFVGFVYLLLKKEKRFSEWFLCFTFIGFSGILLDKNYVRMFIVPFFSMFMAAGWFSFLEFTRHKIIKKDIFINILHVCCVLLLLLGAISPNIRYDYFNQERPFPNTEPYWETGQYIKTLGSDFSTITTRELEAGVIIFASSGIPGGSHNVYYFIDENKLDVQSLSFNELKSRILDGQKVQNIWISRDWIFGGQYYVGRHTLYLFDRSFTDEINQIIIKDYNEKYYIHDFAEDETIFYQSIQPFKNKVYANPYTNVHDIRRGRE